MNVYAKGREIKEGLVIPVAPPAIPGIGTTDLSHPDRVQAIEASVTLR